MPVRTNIASLALAGAATVALLAPSPASAQSYDLDCKLLLCLPGGFPSGCADAFDHMIDRLRDGKSPIGFCALSDGSAFDAYEVDFRRRSLADAAAWQCPPGKTHFHTVNDGDGDDEASITTFCYDRAHTRRSGSEDETSTTYTGLSAPERADFAVNLTLEPGTPAAYSEGWQYFDSGRSSRYRIRHTR